MPGSPNTSFIPKHTSSKIERKNTPRQLFLGTVIVRVLFFAVLIAAVGVFAYERKLSSELSAEVTAFRNATKTFDAEEKSVQEVLSMDRRLIQANNRFDNSLSMVAVLDTLDRATVRTVELDSLEIEKKSDAEILMTAEVTTDTFDSVIYQRSIYEANEILRVTKFEEVTVNQSGIADIPTTPGSLSIRTGDTGNPTISFKATIQIDPTLIPAVMDRVPPSPVAQTTPIVVTAPSLTATSTASSTAGNGLITPNP